MSKRQAIEYLAKVLADAIDEGEVPLHYLTGDESDGCGGTRPDSFHIRRLYKALKTAGMDQAAKVVMQRIVADYSK